MDWKKWIGKHIFVQLRTGSVYSGNVIDVDERDKPHLVWIKIEDKFGEEIVFVHSEIVKMREEKRDDSFKEMQKM